MLALFVLPLAGGAQDLFEAPFRVVAAEGVINVDVGHAAPLYTDFDGDGVADLLVGQFGEGKLRIYENVGAAEAPRFEGFTYLQAGGEDAQIPSTWYVGFGPQWADLDGDGIRDVISGSYAPGDLFFFKGLGEGEYAAKQRVLGTGGEPARAGRASAVAVSDWDDDGDLDLVVGNIDGEVHWLAQLKRHEGVPLFSRARVLVPKSAARQSTSTSSVLGTYRCDAGPHIADWDGDGVDDLLVGFRDGSVHFWKATLGEANRRNLAEPVQLIAATPEEEGASKVALEADATSRELVLIAQRSQNRAKPCVGDWNGDGRPDLLVGDYFNVRGPEPELTDEQMAERARLQSQADELYTVTNRIYEAARKVLTPSVHEGELCAELSALLGRDKEYVSLLEQSKELSARLTDLEAPYLNGGFVWVYLRKADAATGK